MVTSVPILGPQFCLGFVCLHFSARGFSCFLTRSSNFHRKWGFVNVRVVRQVPGVCWQEERGLMKPETFGLTLIAASATHSAFKYCIYTFLICTLCASPSVSGRQCVLSSLRIQYKASSIIQCSILLKKKTNSLF